MSYYFLCIVGAPDQRVPVSQFQQQDDALDLISAAMDHLQSQAVEMNGVLSEQVALLGLLLPLCLSVIGTCFCLCGNCFCLWHPCLFRLSAWRASKPMQSSRIFTSRHSTRP